jgi:copper(I)-binding protein
MLLHGRSFTVLRRASVVFAAALIPAIAGCEAGGNAPVLHWHQPTVGTNLTIPALGAQGMIAIRDVFVLGPPIGASLPAGGSASVFFALVNTGPRDKLMSITAPGVATSVKLPAQGVPVLRDQTVLLTGPVPKVVLSGLTRALAGGQNVSLIMKFQNAGSVTLRVPVTPKAAAFATFSPPAPTPTPSPSGHTSKLKKASTASASPSATP